MPSLRPQPTLTPRPRASLRAQIMGRLRIAQLLTLSERDLARLIAELETDPLFVKLRFPPRPGLRQVVRYERPPGARLASTFYELREELITHGEAVDVEALLAQHRGVIQLIQRMGQERFERYFLYGEEGLSLDEVAEACGLSLEEGRQVHEAIVAFAARAEFFQPMTLPAAQRFTVLARIERLRGGRQWGLAFTSPHLARGRYLIDLEALAQWRREGGITPAERRRLKRLVTTMELINLRQTTLHRTLAEILQRQQRFLTTRLEEHLTPLTLRALAREFRVAPSTISRIIRQRSLITPWGEERPLADFLPSQRRVLRAWLVRFARETQGRVTDETLRQRLAREAHLTVSRRTVTALRHHLERD
ncbi:MAG: hypothetical protein HYZ73_00020 [Elusimicrobia bacterium]|nr:hypothetical protein [Elusimicrobiota bacterium]